MMNSLIPGIAQISLTILKNITWFDWILLKFGQIIGIHSRLLGVSHHDIIHAANQLSDELQNHHTEYIDNIDDNVYDNEEDDDEYLPQLIDDDEDEEEDDKNNNQHDRNNQVIV